MATELLLQAEREMFHRFPDYLGNLPDFSLILPGREKHMRRAVALAYVRGVWPASATLARFLLPTDQAVADRVSLRFSSLQHSKIDAERNLKSNNIATDLLYSRTVDGGSWV